jgi:hypothetical protein
MYEHHSKPLLPLRDFYSRIFRNIIWGLIILFVSISIGILGYHYTENLGWLDSFLNASMILTGMGPVDTMKTVSGKLFASFYSLFSGVAFLSTIAVVIAPVIHRFLHKFHLQEK